VAYATSEYTFYYVGACMITTIMLGLEKKLNTELVKKKLKRETRWIRNRRVC
jgi:hypothetical protein